MEWEALVETTEVWVESLADQPRQSMVPSADNHSPLAPTYIGIDGTFIKAQSAKDEICCRISDMLAAAARFQT